MNKEISFSLKSKLYFALFLLIAMVLLVIAFPNAVVFSIVNILGLAVFIYMTMAILKG